MTSSKTWTEADAGRKALRACERCIRQPSWRTARRHADIIPSMWLWVLHPRKAGKYHRTRQVRGRIVSPPVSVLVQLDSADVSACDVTARAIKLSVQTLDNVCANHQYSGTRSNIFSLRLSNANHSIQQKPLVRRGAIAHHPHAIHRIDSGRPA